MMGYHFYNPHGNKVVVLNYFKKKIQKPSECTDAVKNWASPTTPSEIRKFLGLVGYYGRFIEGFSKIAKPMTELTQKNQKFDWGEEQEEAFQLLKQKLCATPILALPEGSKDFMVYCDSSIKGLGKKMCSGSPTQESQTYPRPKGPQYEATPMDRAPKNTTLLQLLDFSIYDLHWFFYKVEFVIESKLLHWNDKGFVR
ncbi:putative reverse transcriptase domain-containing protein [Tanacetum coccineum]